MVLAQVLHKKRLQIQLHISYFTFDICHKYDSWKSLKQTWFTLLKSIAHLLYSSILSRRHTWRFYKPIAANLIAGESRKRFSPQIAADALGDFSAGDDVGLQPWLKFHRVKFKNCVNQCKQTKWGQRSEKKMLAAAIILPLKRSRKRSERRDNRKLWSKTRIYWNAVLLETITVVVRRYIR